MSSGLFTSIDALAAWRGSLAQGIGQITALLADQGLLDAAGRAQAESLRQRLDTDRLIVAVVAELSRGKSELINALFFGDTGRRVMPAAPGRTTMCPVELAWDPELPPSIALLPIETRASDQPVSALRERAELWRRVPLQAGDADAMAQALEEVTHTRRVTIDEARVLGFWHDDAPNENPLRDDCDRVEVPAWRHALVNYPHPLMRRGLVVIDTPGLNAVGAEPELTLGLLPSAHATLFILAADTGVTRADLTVWREHLGHIGCERLVVLNKIDTLADPLLAPAEVAVQIERQCEQVAQTLGVGRDHVFALSAREALSARIQHEPAMLAESGLPALERALLAQLLPQRSQVIGHMVDDGVRTLQRVASQRLAERQRQCSEQLFELTGLRGKSSARLRLLTHRLEAEAAECERCAPRLAALRTVLSREANHALDSLSSDRVRTAVKRMVDDSESSLLRLGAARAFDLLGEQLRDLLNEAQQRVDDLEILLRASQDRLNVECGLSLIASPRPSLAPFHDELARVEAGYGRHVALTQVWRLAQRGFLDRFARLLQSRLRMIFESAAHEIEIWAKDAGTQLDEQLRDRRRALAQRRDAHARIQAAEQGLEIGIAELEAQQAQLQRLADRLGDEVEALCRRAAHPPRTGAQALPQQPAPRLQLVPLHERAAIGAA